MPCDPAIFNTYCMDKSPDGIFSFTGPPKLCKTAACNFKEIQTPPIVSYFQVFCGFHLFHSSFFVRLLDLKIDTKRFSLNIFSCKAFNVFGFFWGVFFVSALGEMVLAATFATWYWTFHKKDVPYFTLTVGLGRSIR